MRNVKWNCFKISAGTTVGFSGSAAVSYGYGVLVLPFTPFVCPMECPLVPFSVTPFVAPFVSPFVPTPFLADFPPREGAMVASVPSGGER